jgi:hypothetical protein
MELRIGESWLHCRRSMWLSAHNLEPADAGSGVFMELVMQQFTFLASICTPRKRPGKLACAALGF